MARNAAKLVSVLQQRVAKPLYPLNFPQKFSIKLHHLQVSRSNSAGKRRLNSYYSDWIEGNNARPREIERALAGDFDADILMPIFRADSERRALQQEHAAHMRLQAQIDRQAIDGALGVPSDPALLRALHRDFYDEATDEALTIRHAGQVVRLMPGEWRDG